MESTKRSTLVALRRPVLTCALIVGLYYVVPVEPGVAGMQLALRTIGTAVVGVLITWLIVRQVSSRSPIRKRRR
jgi:voltage-gated potassium channel